MKTLNEVYSELKVIMAEIEKIKESTEEKKKDLDFEKISAMAMRNPVSPHPLANKDEHIKRLYLTLLLSFANLDQEALDQSLVFVHRIGYGSKYLSSGMNLQNEYLSSQTIAFKELDEITLVIKEHELSKIVVFEMLLMLGSYNHGRNNAIEYISKLCGLLAISKKQVNILTQLSVLVLCQNIKHFTTTDYDSSMVKTVNDISGYLKYISKNEMEILILRLMEPQSIVSVCGMQWIILERKENNIMLYSKESVRQMTWGEKDSWVESNVCIYLNENFYKNTLNSSIRSRVYRNNDLEKIFLLSYEEYDGYIKQDSDFNANTSKENEVAYTGDWTRDYKRSIYGFFPFFGSREKDVHPALWMNLDF